MVVVAAAAAVSLARLRFQNTVSKINCLWICRFCTGRSSYYQKAFHKRMEGIHMKYILLIYDDEQVRVKSSEAERKQMYGEYAQLTQQIQSGGQYVAGSGLQ